MANVAMEKTVARTRAYWRVGAAAEVMMNARAVTARGRLIRNAMMMSRAVFGGLDGVVWVEDGDGVCCWR